MMPNMRKTIMTAILPSGAVPHKKQNTKNSKHEKQQNPKTPKPQNPKHVKLNPEFQK